MRAGSLRYLVRVERRKESDNGYGGNADVWEAVERGLRARLVLKRGLERVAEGLLQGVAEYEATLRLSSRTRTITTAMRLIDEHDGRVFNITSAEPDERRRVLLLTMTKGGADG